MTLTKAKYSPLSHWSHLVTFLSPEQLSWQIHAFSWYCSSQRYDMMQGLTLFLSSRNYVCLSPQFTYKEIKDTQPHRRCFVVFLKEWFVPFWTAAHYKQITALHLHSVTWLCLLLWFCNFNKHSGITLENSILIFLKYWCQLTSGTVPSPRVYQTSHKILIQTFLVSLWKHQKLHLTYL